MSTPTALPNPFRHITTTSESGTSLFSPLPSSLPTTSTLSGAHFRLAYTAARPPTQLNANADLDGYTSALEHLPHPLVVPGGGPNVWYIDTPPGGESPMHRTVSLDFVLVLSGEIELTLESGEKRAVRPGDMVVQRGTMHKWLNASRTDWCRMVGVMMECEGVVTGEGERLEAAGLGG